MWKASILDGWQDGLNRDEQKRLLLLSFVAVFLFGLAAHAYGFLRAGFSHDMLNALVVEPVETYWKMQLGRPGIVLYRRTVRGLIAAPWMLGLLSLLWLSLACFLIAKLFRIRSAWFVMLTGGILTANLSTIAMTATFLYEMDADCFALLLGVFAVLLWDRWRWPGALIGSLFVTACVGTYQSMVSIPITLVMLLSMAALLRGEAFRPVFRKGLRALAMLALGGLIYWLGVRLMCSWKGINLSPDSYNNVAQAAGLTVFERILHVYRTWAWAFWNPAKAHIEKTVLIVNILLPLLVMIPLLRWLCSKGTKISEKVLLAVLLLLLPLGMNTAQLAFSLNVHELMKYAFWLFYLLCLLPMYLTSAGNLSRITRVAASILVLLLLGANIQTANVVYTRKNLEQNATLSLMTRVLSCLDGQPDYHVGETTLVFVGVSDQLQEQLSGFESTYDIIGCEESSPIEKATVSFYYNAYAAYFRYILNNPAVMADAETWNRMQKDPRVQAMPNFPEDGCMQMVDDLFVIKMGDKAIRSGGLFA